MPSAGSASVTLFIRPDIGFAAHSMSSGAQCLVYTLEHIRPGNLTGHSECPHFCCAETEAQTVHRCVQWQSAICLCPVGHRHHVYLTLALLKSWWRDVPGESRPMPACLKSSRPCWLLGWLSKEGCIWNRWGVLGGPLRLCRYVDACCMSNEGLCRHQLQHPAQHPRLKHEPSECFGQSSQCLFLQQYLPYDQ